MSDERSATNSARLIYALHAVSLLTGILTAASVVGGAFLNRMAVRSSRWS